MTSPVFPTAYRNGALSLRLFAGDRRAATRDGYVLARVFRNQTELFSFAARDAAVSNSAMSRDQQDKFGASAADMRVIAAPRTVAVVKGDEVWLGSRRLRVVAVDAFRHAQQLILEEIQ